MRKTSVRVATQDDIDYIATHLRHSDIVELLASQPDTPEEAVRKSVACSLWTKCGLVDDVPTVLFGVSNTEIEGCGVPWMLGTDDIKHVERRFLVGSAEALREMEARFSYLINQVHRDNDISIKWLKWLGFKVSATPSGPRGEFFTFWKGALNV